MRNPDDKPAHAPTLAVLAGTGPPHDAPEHFQARPDGSAIAATMSRRDFSCGVAESD